MDVLTDTEMPDRCTDALQKTPRHMGCTDAPKSPWHMGNIRYRGNIRCIGGLWGHTDIWWCTDIQGIQMPSMLTTPMPSYNVRTFLFKTKFLHLKNWKIIREPPGCVGNEPILDIPIGCSVQDIKKKNTCHL